jgi:nucleoside-diphosphate-sugar epimerase
MATSPTILITGSAGWLGKRLSRLLAQGEFRSLFPDSAPPKLRCLILPHENPEDLRRIDPGIEISVGDVRDPKQCEAFFNGARDALLFHTAGIIHPRRVSDFYDINLRGTENILRAAVSAGIRRAVVVSSNSPIGCNPHRDHLFDESSPYHPYMNYGKSKMQMEISAREIAEKVSLPLVLIRPPWFYGPDQPPRQTLFFRMIQNGSAPIVGGGENKRSMAYVDNLCQGLVRAAVTERAAGQTYWIADRRPYTMNEIVDTIERLLENEFGAVVKHKRLRLPGIASDVAEIVDATLQSAGIYHQKIHVLSEMNKTIACSIEKAVRELGYDPQIALEEGMRRSLRDWLGSTNPAAKG